MSSALRSPALRSAALRPLRRQRPQQFSSPASQFTHAAGLRQSKPGETASRKPSEQTSSGSGSSSGSGQPELPSFSFQDLGATPTIKLVVYGFLGVVGTLETYTYSRWLYGKFFRKDDEGTAVESSA